MCKKIASEPSKPLKRICGYNPPQCVVFLSVPPDVIERDPRVGLARIFRTVTMGNFPRIYSTYQLSLYHSPFYLFFIEPEPAEDFRVFTQACGIVNTRRFLDSLSPGNFFPYLLAHGAPSGIAIFA